MTGGDKPGCSGSETPDEKIGESSTDIQSEQNEKCGIMSGPESSTSDPISNHDSESGSRSPTPDLTAECSLSLPSERKKKSTAIEVPSEDKEICGALTDSEISKSDRGAQSDTGSGLESPDVKDSSQTPTLEQLETGQIKEDVIPMDKSCLVPLSDVEPKFLSAEDEIKKEQHGIPLNVLDPQAEIPEVNPDRQIINELPPDVGGPTGRRRVWNAICRYFTDSAERKRERRRRRTVYQRIRFKAKDFIIVGLSFGCFIAFLIFLVLILFNPVILYSSHTLLSNDKFLSTEIKATLNLDD